MQQSQKKKRKRTALECAQIPENGQIGKSLRFENSRSMWTDSVGTGWLKDLGTELAFQRSSVLAQLCTPGGKAAGSAVGCPPRTMTGTEQPLGK